MPEEQQQTAKSARNHIQVVVEFGDNRNRQVMLQSLPGTKFRGAFSIANVPAGSINQDIAAMPAIPGMRLAINTKDNKVVIHDPLEQDRGLLGQIRNVMRMSRGLRSRSNITHVPSQERELDPDRMKTLLLELTQLIKINACRVVKGEFPSAEQIQALPGHELYDPADDISPIKPTYKHEVHEWRMRRLMGSK